MEVIPKENILFSLTVQQTTQIKINVEQTCIFNSISLLIFINFP